MSHHMVVRYGELIDKKLRNDLVTKDGIIFNTRYEGNPKAGLVQVPTRDTEVEVENYDKQNGIEVSEGVTSYVPLPLTKDKAVNELIDGFEAQAVPDNVIADRLESASYSLAKAIDKDSIEVLEGVTTNKVTNTTESTTPYADLMKVRAKMSRVGVPKDKRWAIVSPEFLAKLMQDSNFIKEGDLSQELVMNGAVGKCGGFVIYESNHMTTAKVDGTFNYTTEFICGHPDFCCRVMEWQVPVHLQDLNGSGKYIGASAIQGRKIYGATVTKEQTVFVQQVKKANS